VQSESRIVRYQSVIAVIQPIVGANSSLQFFALPAVSTNALISPSYVGSPGPAAFAKSACGRLRDEPRGMERTLGKLLTDESFSRAISSEAVGGHRKDKE